ncbi:MAG: SDR family oxidoreductase [Pirellulales bacterium]
MNRLIVGCGYLGGRIAARWRECGDRITVVTRNAEKAARLTEDGHAAIVADVTQPAMLHSLPRADTVLYAIGFDRSAGASIDEVYAAGLRHVLDALPSDPDRVIYISTTGVYGSAAGNWVDEETPPAPARDGGRASLAAEEVLRTHPLGQSGVILRSAGIYGPNRVPFLDQLRAGEPIPAPESGYLNLIHVDDAAETVLHAAAAVIIEAPRVFCVSDGKPVIRGDYYREVALRVGAPPPTFVPPAADSPRALRAGSDRRVKNDRMLLELGVKLRYPSYREGLAAILG